MRWFAVLLFALLLISSVTGNSAQMPPPPYGDDNDFPGGDGPPPFTPPGRRFVPHGPDMEPAQAASHQPNEYILSALSPAQKKATFSGNVRASIVGQFLEIESNGIPNHRTGNYPNEHNPNYILPQDYHFYIPLKPKIADRITPLPFGPIGVAVNGIPFYNPYNAEGRDAVFGPNAEIFDSCCGHPDPMGRYHYHKYPVCVNSPFRDQSGKHSPLIGWAFDGFAIYGPNGEDGQPAKDLDQCNGHIDEARGYHYHVTSGFPYVLGGYRGVVELSNFDGPVWGRRR